MSKTGGAPLLAVRGVKKSFPGVQALCGVDLTLQRGEVLALLGENGAGKSTLMRIIGGAQRPDAGTLEIEGRPVRFSSPQEARRAGIAVIYQEFNLVPALTAAENIFLGQEPGRFGFIDRGSERRRAAELLARLGVTLDLDTRCDRISIAQQQLVEIARALASDARLLIMDEPTAALSSHESERLFAIIAELKARGLGIIYISHRLEEVSRIADRVSVMRDGANVAERPIAEITRSQMIEFMVGRELKEEFPKRSVVIGGVLLTVRDLSRPPMVNDFMLRLRAGELVAVTGLVGSGRTEAARLIFGADRRAAGEIRRGRRPVKVRGPRDAIAAGIGLLPEDRKLQGLILQHSVKLNFALPNLSWISSFGFIRRRRELRYLRRYIDSLRIKIPDHDEPVGNLSGGNQQKVVLAKWLARDCEVLIFDEPTRGVDVGAKVEIYQLMNELLARGKAILMISSEIPEVIGMADRILVMRDGRITGEINDVSTTSPQEIMELAVA